jgi:hypothetical protein
MTQENEETVVIVGSDGKQVEGEDASGVILRGEDADKYLAGENVSVPGVGVVNANDGVVTPANVPGNSGNEAEESGEESSDEPAAESAEEPAEESSADDSSGSRTGRRR